MVAHPVSLDSFHRTAKILMQKFDLSYEGAVTALHSMKIHVAADDTICNSKAMQAAFITAVAVGMRAFQGGVAVTLPSNVPLLLPWPGAKDLNDLVDTLLIGHRAAHFSLMPTIAIGTPPGTNRDALYIHGDGWRGGISPDPGFEFSNGPDFPLGGIVGACLAVHGAFLRHSRIDPAAASTASGINLWAPGSDWLRSPTGPALQYLPKQLWALGLGHLGQGFLWSLGMFSCPRTTPIRILLQDFDRVTLSNWAAGLLCTKGASGASKVRIAAEWLEMRGFETTLLERRFDKYTRRQENDPCLAFCAFDSLQSRRSLDDAKIPFIVECGIGGGVSTFDKLSFHTLPYPGRTSEELWTAENESEESINPELLAKLDAGHPCGVLAQSLARTSISTPFVGAFAGALGLAEILRAYHGGPRVIAFDGQLRSLSTMRATIVDAHSPAPIAENGFVPAI